MTGTAGGDSPEYAIDARWIGALTLGVALGYALATVFSIAILSSDPGLAGLFFLGVAVAGGLGFAIFTGIGLALIRQPHGGRRFAFRAHLVGAVLSFPVGSIPHGIVALLTRRRSEPDDRTTRPSLTPEPQAEKPTANAEPGSPSPGAQQPQDLPVGILVLVGLLAVGAGASLLSLLWTLVLGTLTPGAITASSLGLHLVGGVGSAALAWGLFCHEPWAYWLVHVPVILLALTIPFQPWIAFVVLALLWYLHRPAVKRSYLPAAPPSQA